MKILMIASYLPYPLYSGGQIRLFNLLKQLKSNHEITLICEKRENQTDLDVKEIQKICSKVISVKRGKQWSLRNIFLSITSTHSFLVTGHTHREMQRIIKKELENNQFDLIHVETFYVMQNLLNVIASGISRNVNIPIVLVEHNIEYLVYSRFVKQAPFLMRPLFAIDVAKIKNEEINFWKKASVLAAVSHKDQKIMRSEDIHAEVIPNGVNTDRFTFKNRSASQKEKKILFIGDFRWIQNRDSLFWIIKEIWPKIKSGFQNSIIASSASLNGGDEAIPLRIGNPAKLWIVGRNIPNSIKKLTNDPDITFDEKSSERPAWEIFQEADILLAPIRVGGGTSYKILESMSCGTPVVITPLSAQAMGLKNLQEALVAEEAEEIAKNSLLVLNDSQLYKEIAQNGREFIEKNYTWGKISKKLNEVYQKMV